MAKEWSWKQGDALTGLPRELRKYAAIIESMHTEDDGCFEDSRGRRQTGIWVYLTSRLIFRASECGTAHEPNVKTIAGMFNGIAFNEDCMRLLGHLLQLDASTLAIMADAIEEGRPVAAWEDGGPSPVEFHVEHVNGWPTQGGGWHAQPTHDGRRTTVTPVKAFSAMGAMFGWQRRNPLAPAPIKAEVRS